MDDGTWYHMQKLKLKVFPPSRDKKPRPDGSMLEDGPINTTTSRVLYSINSKQEHLYQVN